jgi:intracellular sulfur oxidation DsrE/DsrF family protein
MKKILTLLFASFFAFNLWGQEQPVKIVFDVTSDDPKVHQATIRHVKFMSNAYDNAEFEVVMYSGSQDMFIKEKSSVAEDLEALAKKDNITFVACKGTMKRHKVTEDDLVPGITQVPDGILEIINKQAEGWGYIKEGQ